MCKNFIIQSKHVLGNDPHLWIAFQSNALNDRNDLNYNFKPQFNEMMEFVDKELEFHVPKLNLNMRNSREVTEVAKTMESKISTAFGAYEITNVIDSLKTLQSSITSYKPTLIPIFKGTLVKNYSKLFEHATENGKMKVILISSEEEFDVQQIKKAVLKCNVNEEDIFVHTFDSSNTKEDIKCFLRNPNGFLICQDELFNGMEAKSVVFCVSDSDYSKNIRSNVMRTCEKLNIVYCYEKDIYYINFRSAKMDPTFVDGCDVTIEGTAWKCLTCESISKALGDDKNVDYSIVCRSCSLSCHIGHELERKSVRNELNMMSIKCPCASHFPCCLFKSKSVRKKRGFSLGNLFKK